MLLTFLVMILVKGSVLLIEIKIKPYSISCNGIVEQGQGYCFFVSSTIVNLTINEARQQQDDVWYKGQDKEYDHLDQ